MKKGKIIKKITLLICMLATVSAETVLASAAKSTSYTFTQSTTTDELEIVEDAFLPDGAYLELGIDSAQDMDVKNGLVYIADTGNGRVLVLDPKKSTVCEVGVGLLSKPEGVAADNEGRIYVADYQNGEVYRFSKEGVLEQTFQKPEGVIYGEDTTFSPRKVAPDGNGGVYIIVDGSVNGLIQMNEYGEFLGYFASNSVNKSFYAKFLDIFLTDKQLARFAKLTPDSFGNIFYGEDGLVYGTCMGTGRKIQKFSYSGTDIFAGRSDIIKLDNIVDICMSSEGYIYLLTGDGMITEMTAEGHMLYKFGGMNKKTAQLGLTSSPSGIGVDGEGNVYVLDKNTNVIHVYKPTEEHNEIIQALNSYSAGDYSQAKTILLETLKYNSSSYFAHLYLGMTYMHEGEYELAAVEFEKAKAWPEYSEAYWEIRNDLLEKNIIYIVVAVLALVGVILLWKKKFPQPPYNSYMNLDSVKNQWQQYIPKNIKRIVYHPVDAAYMLRASQLGHGYLAPILVIFVGYIIFSGWRLCSGPIFSTTLDDYSLLLNFVFYVAVFSLFIICHYLIVSILDGESSLKMIVSAVSFALLPFILTFPIFTLLKNFLTLNEKLLISTVEVAVILLCLVLLFVMLKTMHDYSVGKLIATLLLTVFLAIVVVLFGSLLYLMCKQIIDFIIQIYMEVVIRG